MADQKLSALTSIPSVDRAADLLYIVKSVGLISYKVTTNSLLGITGAPVGDTDTQTLSAKTLTSPVINGATLSGTLSGTYTIGGTPTFPATVVTTTGSQTLTNKVLTSPTINTPTITNATITANAISGFSTANSGTIYGVPITLGVLTTANTVNGSSLVAGTVTNAALAASATGWTSWTPTFTNWTIGTGGAASTSAHYTQIGKTVMFVIVSVLGSTGQSVGSAPTFTLPTTLSGDYTGGTPIGTVRMVSGGAGFYGYIRENNSTSAAIIAIGTASTYANDGNVSSTTPGTWAAGDQIQISGFYETV